MDRKTVENNLILVALTGSKAYGLNIEGSDTDYRGIFIAPQQYQLGLTTIEQKDSGWMLEEGTGYFPYLTNKDTCCFELKKYLRLALNCNPNILEILYCKKYKYINAWGQELINNKHLFLSKKAKTSYSGYAKSELRKMQNPDNAKFNAEVGYNTKKGAHVIRLLSMGLEILEQETVIVDRRDAGDREELLAIRNGEAPLKDILSKAEDLQNKLDSCYVKSNLPKNPDFNKVNELCIKLVKDYV